MRPVIGIPLRCDIDKTTNLSITCIYENLRRNVQRLGADIMPIAPVVDVDSMKTKLSDFPEITDQNIITLNKFLDMCDGLILPGGNKILPTDKYILDYAIKHDIPVLGICLSMQMMSCYKEEFQLEKNSEEGINHQQDETELFKHKVKIAKDSLLFEVLKQDEIEVNSFHSYHVKENPYYKPVAFSEDGIIEAVEYPSNTFNIGVQWHPERSIEEDPNSKKILKYFIEVAKLSKNEILYEESI